MLEISLGIRASVGRVYAAALPDLYGRSSGEALRLRHLAGVIWILSC